MKNLKTKISMLAGAAAVACAVSGLTAAPAQAATGWNRCPSGYFCAFDGGNGTGKMAYFKWGSPNLSAQGMNNKISSYWNRTGRAWKMWDGANYTGRLLLWPGPHYRSSFASGSGPYNANNRTTSLKAA